MTDKLVKEVDEGATASRYMSEKTKEAIAMAYPPTPHRQDVVKKENDFGAEIAALIHKAGTIKLTKAQETILYAPVVAEDVEIRPDGLVYLPWMEYETRLRKAFSMEYALIPQGMPRLEGNLIMWGHWLVIKGCPMGFSFGQQEYKPTNPTMTWGDAIEGAKSNALMRLCKGLGITLELWKPSWVKAWKAKYALSYFDKKKGKYLWKKIEKEPVFVKGKGTVAKDEGEIVDFETQKGESYVATVDVPKDEKATMQKDIIPPEDEVQMGEIIQEEMNKRDKKTESPQDDPTCFSANEGKELIVNIPETSQNAPESTQKEKLTLTPEKETKEDIAPEDTRNDQEKVVDLAQEITGEEIPYICSVRDGCTEPQFNKIKEFCLSHYVTDNEKKTLKAYLLNGRMTKVDASACIDYLLARLKFYGAYERELVKAGVVKNVEMAATILSYVVQDLTDTDRVKNNKSQYTEVIKKAVEGKK